MLHYLMFASQTAQSPFSPPCHPERSEGSAFLRRRSLHQLRLFDCQLSAVSCQPLSSPISHASEPLFSLFRAKPEKLNPSFSHSSTLFKKECFNNSFPINTFRTLSQNTGGC